MTTPGRPARRKRPPLHKTLLQLGRVSNVATVAVNVFTGVAFAPPGAPRIAVALLVVAMSLAYIGGMFLNDAFDEEHDSKHQPDRPIPRGDIDGSIVYLIGFSLLGVSIVMTLVAPALRAIVPGAALLSSLCLAAAIVAYDAWHKQNPAAPALMGLCRALVPVTCALALGGSLGAGLVVAALLLLGYVMMLTAVARGGHPFWSSGRGVALLIAGISVIDALIIATRAVVAHRPHLFILAGLALLAVPTTLRLQRWVRGT